MRRFLCACTLLLLVGVVSAGEIKIAWYGQSMFLIVTPTGKRIVLDPHNLEAYRITPMKADLVLMSHFHVDHNKTEVISNIKEAKQFNAMKNPSPIPPFGEWNDVDEKFGDVHFQSVGTFHDQMSGLQRGKNGCWILDIDGIRIVHLGDLGHQLTKAQLKKLGTVDVLLIPVGGVYTLDGIKAFEVAQQVKPKRFVIPMHYGTIVYSDLLPINYFMDEVKDANWPVVKQKPREWLTIDTKAAPPKQASVAVLDYSGAPPDIKLKGKDKDKDKK